MLAVRSSPEEKRPEVLAGRIDIYSRDPVITWFHFFGWLMNTKQPGLHLAHSAGTSSTISLETRISRPGEDLLRHRALPVHHTPP